MRRFYLTKNSYGYYYVRIVNPVTGKPMTAKSTHTKDLYEAMEIAGKWADCGLPKAVAGSRIFYDEIAGKSNLSNPNIERLFSSLSDNDVASLLSMISQRVVNNDSSKVGSLSGLESDLTPRNVFAKNNSSSQIFPKAVSAKPVNKKISGKEIRRTAELTHKNGLYKYLFDFWDMDNSQFISEENALGHTVTRRYCDDMQTVARKYWLAYFGENATVEMLDSKILQDFFFYLRLEVGLSGSTVNKAINCGKRAIDYLFSKGEIKTNPFLGVKRFSQKSEKRGIPTESEVRALMELDWENDVSKLAFQLAAFCGLRAGEISGLQVCDIDFDAELLHIRHSWNTTDGLKSTKNGLSRDVPIDAKTAIELMRLAKRCPNYSDTSFVFWSSTKPSQPCWPQYYEDGFYDAMKDIGISEEQRKERNIVFHSLRHFCATTLRQRLDLGTVQEILGHQSVEMTKHYSDHESQGKFKAMREALKDTRDAILKSA